jgi:hypothetical protein
VIAAFAPPQLTVAGATRIGTINVFADGRPVCPVGDEVLFCPDGASVAAVALRSGAVRPVCPAFGRVARLAADAVFRIVAVATVEGQLQVCDLLTGERVRAADLGAAADLLAVTPKWGYVVALARGSIVVLSVNGEVLRRRDAPWAIVAWFPFASPADMDFIAFVTKEQKVGAFEPIRPEAGWVFHESRPAVRAVAFDPAIMAFVIVSEHGNVALVPAPLGD